MEKGKIFEFIRRRGTLGILTLVLVGAVAFASYRTSYPVTRETEMTEQEEKKGKMEDRAVSTPEVAVQRPAAENADPVPEEAASAVSGSQITTDGKKTEAADSDLIHGTDVEKSGEELAEETVEQETEKADQVLSGSVISPTVQFSEDSVLSWPAAGSVLMDYSMDGTVYFQTLNEYKYNPALIIRSEEGNPVVAAAKGIVEHIERNEETGMTLTMNIGDNYELVYGQLKDLAVAEGDVAEQGELLGYVSEPTRYYCEEGSNLYFAMKKDGEIVDPCLYLE